GEELATAQDIFVGRKVFGGLRKDALRLEAGELDGPRADHSPGDVVLDAEDVFDFGVVGFGPDMNPRPGLGQLDINANAIAGAADAALWQIARIQQAANFGRLGLRILERETRGFSDDQQVREAAKRGDDVFGDPVAEEVLPGITGQVLER